MSSTSTCWSAERIALLIGNQGYNAKVGALKNPHRDIDLIGKALASLSFKVALVKDADYKTINTSISRHIQAVNRVGQGALSFVYYAGHGAANPDTKTNYLIPVDAPNADDTDLWANSVALNIIVDMLHKQAPGATHYVVFDACRSELNLTHRGRALVDRGFVPIHAEAQGLFIAYSTAPTKTATDAGVYARALATEIVKPGVASLTMFQRVALQVNREIGQNPWMAASTLPEVYFAGAATPGGQPPPPNTAVKPPPPPPRARGASVATCADAYRKLAAVRNDVSGMAIVGLNGGTANMQAYDEGMVLRTVGSLPPDCAQAAEQAGAVKPFQSEIAAALQNLRVDTAGAVAQIVNGRRVSLTPEQVGDVNRSITDIGRDPHKRLSDAAHVSLMAALARAVGPRP